MEDSFYDSFRWLDEDTDLDLSLDNYQQQVTNSSTCLPQRRRPSCKRTLSFNSVNLSRKSTPLTSYGKAPTSNPPADSQSILANIASRRSSISRPSSKSKHRHVSQSSTSSIDPSAQYYHDPEARLKLRVYLASPQKFDEAIEFGFPALKDNGPIISKPAPPTPSPQIREFTGTFLDDDDDDDDASIYNEKKEAYSNISRLSYVMENARDSQDLPILDNKWQSLAPLSEPDSNRDSSMREMTLRMTLTRPDLRADSCPSPTLMAEPAESLHLSRADGGTDSWEPKTDDQSLMKRMWRKFRRRKY